MLLWGPYRKAIPPHFLKLHKSCSQNHFFLVPSDPHHIDPHTALNSPRMTSFSDRPSSIASWSYTHPFACFIAVSAISIALTKSFHSRRIPWNNVEDPTLTADKLLRRAQKEDIDKDKEERDELSKRLSRYEGRFGSNTADGTVKELPETNSVLSAGNTDRRDCLRSYKDTNGSKASSKPSCCDLSSNLQRSTYRPNKKAGDRAKQRAEIRKSTQPENYHQGWYGQ